MPQVTYRQGSSEIAIEVSPGTSLMQAAIDEDIDGIVGECGGNAMCATCHVYVAQDALSKLPPMADDENEMLQCTSSPRLPNSRLSCQIRVTTESGDLSVEIPEEQ